MFNKLDRNYLFENPFILIGGDFYKFKEFCFVETGGETALFVAVCGTDKKMISVETLREKMQFENQSVTAAGRLYELLLETKRMIEIGNMK